MLKKILKIIITTILASIILAIILFFWGIKTIDTSETEKKLIYKPSNRIFELIPEIASGAEEGSFLSENNTKITYLRINGRKKSPVIVFCHGNNGNMTLPGNQNKMKFLVQSGYEVFMHDYEGFGKSEGMPDEKNLYSSLDSFVLYLNKELNIPESNIVLWGHSLGSAVVIDVASRKDFKGVIIEGAFTSTEEMRDYIIKNNRTGNPIDIFLRDYLYNSIEITQKFDSKSKISLIKSPMLIIHAINDEQVPYITGKKLAELKPDAETYFSETGSHNDYGWQNEVVLEFLGKSD